MFNRYPSDSSSSSSSSSSDSDDQLPQSFHFQVLNFGHGPMLWSLDGPKTKPRHHESDRDNDDHRPWTSFHRKQ